MRLVTALGIAATFAASAPAAGAQLVGPPPSADPYRAGLAYAACMRAHGVPHPDPDRNGDFRLTPAQDRALRAAGHRKVETATRACFKYLKPVVSTKPLSPTARLRAKAVLAQVRECMRKRGFELGPPVVKNLTLGRAFFGFLPGDRPTKAMNAADLECERRVQLASRLDAIIAADRVPV